MTCHPLPSTVPWPSMQKLLAIFVGLAAAGFASKTFGGVIFLFDETYSEVRDPTSLSQSLQNTGGATVIAQLSGNFSRTTSTFSVDAITVDFAQSREGVAGDLALGLVFASFLAVTDTAYTISGSITGSGGFTRITSGLNDSTNSANDYLLLSQQQYDGGPIVLTVGGLGGNLDNLLEGSLTGTLLAGHTYSWFVAAHTQAFSASDGGASAFGNGELRFGSPDIENRFQVPEPSTWIVFIGIATMALAVPRRQMDGSSGFCVGRRH